MIASGAAFSSIIHGPDQPRVPESPVLKRSNFADDLADLQKSAGIEFSMASFHGFDMVGLSAPDFERFL